MSANDWKASLKNDQGTDSIKDDEYKISKPWYDHIMSFIDETGHNIGKLLGTADEKSATQIKEEMAIQNYHGTSQSNIESGQNLQNAVNNTMYNAENPNMETAINGMDLNSLMEQSKEWRDAQWAREDAIRKEIQDREDSAISRKVADMRAAGVNPNIAYSMSGAESGGGITNATGLDTNPITTFMNNVTEKEKQAYQQEFDKALAEWEKYIDQNFEGDQKEKDRIVGIVTSLIKLSGILGIFA